MTRKPIHKAREPRMSISVSLPNDLLFWLDQHTKNRSATVEEALRLLIASEGK